MNTTLNAVLKMFSEVAKIPQEDIEKESALIQLKIMRPDIDTEKYKQRPVWMLKEMRDYLAMGLTEEQALVLSERCPYPAHVMSNVVSSFF